METLLSVLWDISGVLGKVLLWSDNPNTNAFLFIAYGLMLVIGSCMFLHVDKRE